MSKVVSIGCPTEGWDEQYEVNDALLREMRQDPSLQRLFERKLRDHARRMPRLLGRGKSVVTPLWRGRDTGELAVLDTLCHRLGRIITSAYYVYGSRS